MLAFLLILVFTYTEREPWITGTGAYITDDISVTWPRVVVVIVRVYKSCAVSHHTAIMSAEWRRSRPPSSLVCQQLKHGGLPHGHLSIVARPHLFQKSFIWLQWQCGRLNLGCWSKKVHRNENKILQILESKQFTENCKTTQISANAILPLPW